MRPTLAFIRLPLVFTLLMPLSARAELAPSAERATSLEVGAPAPSFSATQLNGHSFHFDADHRAHPAVIIFYRGGWCPYCNAQLSGLHEVEPSLRAQGFEVIFLSTDRPKILYSSLQAQDIHYTLLSDTELRAAQAFHIAYRLTDEEYAQQLKWGVDLEKTTGNRLHALPVPSVYVIDRTGIIRFVYSNADFRVRLSAQELWKAAAPFGE